MIGFRRGGRSSVYVHRRKMYIATPLLSSSPDPLNRRRVSLKNPQQPHSQWAYWGLEDHAKPWGKHLGNCISLRYGNVT